MRLSVAKGDRDAAGRQRHSVDEKELEKLPEIAKKEGFAFLL